MSSASLRITQARQRATELLEDITRWHEGNHCTPELSVSDDRRSFEFLLHLDSEPPSDRWGLLLGEALHHLRSGLDNAVYGRAAAHSNGSPNSPRKLHFPICSTEQQFQSSVAQALGEAQDELEPTVRAFQPFGTGQGDAFLQPGDALRGQHPLTLLADLNNADKHREWAALPPSLDQIQLGSEGAPFAIEFDDLTGVEDPVFELEILDRALSSGDRFFRATCKAAIKRIEANGGLNVAVGIPTPAGALQAEAVLQGLLMVCGLVMLRVEDPIADIDVIYDRLMPLLG